MNIDSVDMSNGRQVSVVNKNRATSNALSCSVVKMNDPENMSNKTVHLMATNGSHTSLCDEASPISGNHHDHARSTASLLPAQQQQEQQQQLQQQQQQQQQTQLENVIPTGIIVTNQLIIEAN